MGIGTLIIFIATILVAAVAAGVIISTAGLLQQRSLIVSDDARKRLVNTVEIISVIAEGNSTQENLRHFESLLRLGPGSNPIQLRTMGISMLTQTWTSAASLSHTSIDNYSYRISSSVNTTNWVSVPDRDSDGVNELIQLFIGADGYLDVKMNLSNPSLADAYATANLGKINFSGTTSQQLTNIEAAFFDDSQNLYGYIVVHGYNNGSQLRPTSSNITIQNFVDTCNFDLLEPENHWCYQIKLGNSDTVLEAGETVNILYTPKRGHELGTDDEFELTYYPDRGALSRINRKTPDVITAIKVFIFP